MVNSLLKSGLRAAAISRNVLEKKIIKPASSVVLNRENILKTRECTSQFCQIAKRNYSKRNVHHTKTSASIEADEESGSESDSDKEDRGTTHFWRRKMRTLHSHLDVNKDGVISYDDFMLLGKRFTELGHLTPEAQKEFEKVLEEMWEEQWGEISPYNLICIEKYLEEMHHVLNDNSLKKKCHKFLPFLFKAVDNDQNGEISVEEFKLFFQCLGLTNDHAVVSFSHIDLNEDGKISLKEFVSLGRDFILTEDEKRPSKHFWGPLVH